MGIGARRRDRAARGPLHLLRVRVTVRIRVRVRVKAMTNSQWWSEFIEPVLPSD